MNKTILTIEQEQEICKSYNSGASKKKLAKLFHVRDDRIDLILEKHGTENNQHIRKTILFSSDEIKICEDYNNGMILRDIRKKYKIINPTIKQILAKHNISIRENLRCAKLSKENEQRVIHLYCVEKMDIKPIGKLFNVDFPVIYRILKKHSITPPANGYNRLTNEDLLNIVNLYISGESVEGLAIQFDCSDGTINKILNSRSVIRRKRGRVLSLDEELKICKLYNEEYKTTKEICDLMGIYHRILKPVLLKYGCKIRDFYESIVCKGGVNLNEYAKSKHSYGGYYKDWYFRSLNELTYCIKELEWKNKSWRCEGRDIAIPFFNPKKNRTCLYYPDFLVENKTIIEIKCEKFRADPTVILKQDAAIRYCSERNLDYQLVVCDKDLTAIKSEYLLGYIKFDERKRESNGWKKFMGYLNNDGE